MPHPSTRYRIAPGVSALWEGSAWRITGLGGVSRVVPDTTLMEVLGAFARPATIDEAAQGAPQFERAAFDLAVRALIDMRALIDDTAVDASVAPHDLAFHVRAREGRIRPLEVTRAPPRPSSSPLALPRPTTSAALDVAGLHAMRRSRRGARALTVDQLSRALFAAFVETGAGRPHPSAGALHAVVPHVAARADGVAGLEHGGVHRYDAHAHALERLDVDGGPLLERARVAADLPAGSTPAVVVVFVCDLVALHAKYEGVAYALALKEAGAMMMALAYGAVFAGIDACPLGAGALVLDESAMRREDELVVGEMILSGRA